MNKVVTINLAGNAYQLEEGAYDALRRYLDDARAKLANDPDLEEILADLEAAIGGKCAAYLTAQKNVITGADMDAILSQMGPVDGAESGEAKEEAPKSASRPKRLYRLPEQEVVFGVCAGLAAYFDIDVTLVRIIFIILAVLTSGAWIVVYFLMMLFIPIATTPEAREAAYGTPKTAQELIDSITRGYHESMKQWQRWTDSNHGTQAKAEMHAWKHRMKAERRHWKNYARQYRYDYRAQYRRSPFWEFMGSLLGLVWLAFIIFLLWLGYHHVPAIQNLLDTLGHIFGGWLDRFSSWLGAHVH